MLSICRVSFVIFQFLWPSIVTPLCGLDETSLIAKSKRDFSVSSSGTSNTTIFIVPVHSSAAEALLPPNYDLLPLDKSLLPGFPDGQHPLFVLVGQDYNITGTEGLFKFAMARLAVPFVDRLRDGKTPFSYTPSIYTDNPLTLLAATFTTHTNVYLASIRPPMGSKQALYSEGKTLGISVHEKNSESSGVAFVGEQSTLSDLPWPVDSFHRIANQPSFGAKSDKCFNHTEYAPHNILSVVGDIWLGSPPLLQETTVQAVFGVSAVNFFSESFDIDCKKFAL